VIQCGADIVGSSIRPGEKTSLNDMMERNLNSHLPKLEEISESVFMRVHIIYVYI